MNKLVFVAAALAVALVGCEGASIRMAPERGFYILQHPRPDKPQVYVDDSVVIIDQEPIHIKRHIDPVKIAWTLDHSQVYELDPGRPITWDLPSGTPEPGCSLAPDRKTLTCSYDHPRPNRTKFKYTLNLLNPLNRLERLFMDPTVMND